VLLLATVHISMGLYLSNVFAPNHKGMPQVAPGASISFLEQQVVTTRNVKPGLFTDFIHMGLNYQIEHHLFPTCPRRNLKRLTPYVLQACEDLGLPYTQVSFAESHQRIISRLAHVAKCAREESLLAASRSAQARIATEHQANVGRSRRLLTYLHVVYYLRDHGIAPSWPRGSVPPSDVGAEDSSLESP
jgi:hypothetical protein